MMFSTHKCVSSVTSQRLSGVFPLLLLLSAMGCGSSDDPRGRRYPAAGTVTMNGLPLDAGRIYFLSDQGAGEVRASAMIQEGAFAFEGFNGPLAGTARVEIRAAEMELEELEARLRQKSESSEPIHLVKTWIPPDYNTRSKLTANVSDKVDENHFQFELVSR